VRLNCLEAGKSLLAGQGNLAILGAIWIGDSPVSARRAVPQIVLTAILAIYLLSIPYSLQGQQCHTAHDPNALKALREKAATGDADAECGLGKQYEFALGVKQDNQQAVLWLQESAEQGDIAAQVELGVVFDKMQDYGQALIWYRKAADQGNARAEYNIGLAYQDGESVPKDVAQAMVWYRKAADQGDALAQFNIGDLYDEGIDVPQDYRAGRRMVSQGR
jgi:TPR repeat protein